jgi:hypothetical protein
MGEKSPRNCRIYLIEHHVCVVYNHHFAIYNKDKTKVTQSIPSIVWKVVYVAYKMDCPNFEF